MWLLRLQRLRPPRWLDAALLAGARARAWLRRGAFLLRALGNRLLRRRNAQPSAGAGPLPAAGPDPFPVRDRAQGRDNTRGQPCLNRLPEAGRLAGGRRQPLEHRSPRLRPAGAGSARAPDRRSAGPAHGQTGSRSRVCEPEPRPHLRSALPDARVLAGDTAAGDRPRPGAPLLLLPDDRARNLAPSPAAAGAGTGRRLRRRLAVPREVPVRAHWRRLPSLRGLELEPAGIRVETQPVVLAVPASVRRWLWGPLLRSLGRLGQALVELGAAAGLHLLAWLRRGWGGPGAAEGGSRADHAGAADGGRRGRPDRF